MQPTSAATVIVLCLLAIGAIAASVLFWGRLAAPGPVRVAGRVATQVTVVAVCLLAAAGVLNRHYGFYPTWPGLAGAISGTPPTQGSAGRAGAPAHHRHADPAARRSEQATDRRYAPLRSRTQAALRLRAHPGPGGQYVAVTVPGLGPAAGHGFRAGRVILWLPPAYTDPAQQGRTFPVIEAFHGVPGGPRDWHRVDHLQNVLGAAVGTHAMAQPIVVMPDTEPGGLDTECVNGGGMGMETWLTKDVPQWVITHLRARSAPAAWATMGYSAGGWCAAMAGLLHPGRYAAAILLGAYFHPEFSNWHPYPPGRTPSRYRLTRLIRRRPPATNVWIQVSTADPESGPASQAFVADARPPLSVTAFTQHNVGHRVDVFMAILPRALAWLGRTLPAFRPPGPSRR